MCYIRHQTDYDLQDIVNDTEHLFGDIQVMFLVWILFSLLAMASSASAASAGSSMISKYISQVRAELRRQRPEGREAWLKAEMDTMQLGSSHEGKPSVRDVFTSFWSEVSVLEFHFVCDPMTTRWTGVGSLAATVVAPVARA